VDVLHHCVLLTALLLHSSPSMLIDCTDMDHPTLFLCARSRAAPTSGQVFALDGPAPASSEHLRAYVLRPRTLYLRIFYNETDARIWVADATPGDADVAVVLDEPNSLTLPFAQSGLHPQDCLLRTFRAGTAPALVDLFDVDSTTAFFTALRGSTSLDGVRVESVSRYAAAPDVIDVDQVPVPGGPPTAGRGKRRRSWLSGHAAIGGGSGRASLSTVTRRRALPGCLARGRSVILQAAEQTPTSVPSWTREVGGSSSTFKSRLQRHSRDDASRSSSMSARHRVAWSYGGPGGWRDRHEDLQVARLPRVLLPATLGGAVLKVCRLLAARTSVFLTGPPGCGKTYLINDVVKALRAAGAAVSVCGSTGVASALVGGTTVHAWAGFINGDADVAMPLDVVLDKVIPFAAKKRICSSMVLVIDEVGTLSAAFITRLDLVLRGVRRLPDAPFGGLTVLFSGDFLQLAPPFGNYAVVSQVWCDVLGSRAVVLDTHWRHIQDCRLLDLLLRMRVGNHTKEDMDLLATRRSADPPRSAVWLFCHILKAKEKNEDEIRRLPGKEVTYHARDVVKAKYIGDVEAANVLDTLRYPRTLSLRVGACVIVPSNCLMKNGVPCGSRGIVLCFFWVGCVQYPTVRFELPTGGFSTVDVVPATGSVVALDGLSTAAPRTQVPLVLGWAMTIHGAQGWTLLEVAVDLSRAWAAGQALSGLSRTPTLSGLHLVGFDEKKVIVDSLAASFNESLVPY